jgi:RHS repeat-associated protein
VRLTSSPKVDLLRASGVAEIVAGKIAFNTGSSMGVPGFVGEPVFKATSWTFPNGIKLTFTYQTEQVSFFNSAAVGPSFIHYYLRSVSNNLGRTLNFSSAATGPCSQDQIDTHGNLIGPCQTSFNVGQRITQVSDENGRTVQFAASGCPVAWSLPAVTSYYGMACPTVTVTDPMGFQSQYSYVADANSPDPSVIVRPNYKMRSLYAAEDIANNRGPLLRFRYDDVLRVASQTDELSRTSTFYVGGLLDSERYKRAEHVDPTGAHWVSVFDDRYHQTLSTDPLNRSTTYAYDGMGRLTQTTYPEGNAETLTYDVRSNVLTQCQISKSHAGQACSVPNGDLQVTKTYFEDWNVITCTGPATCNVPRTVTNARGFTTNFSVTGFGAIASISQPADPAGHRPWTYFGYTATAVNSGSVQLLTLKNEQIDINNTRTTNYTYNPANKYVLQTAIVDPASVNPDGMNLTTAFTFDVIGNLTAVDGPRAGTADTWTYTWDNNRRLTNIADPAMQSGVSVLTTYTYDKDGLLIQAERGAGVQPHNVTAYLYDAVGNRIRQTTINGGFSGSNIMAVSQTSYDGADRPVCSVVRMNANNLGNPPADACAQDVLTSAGPDRISRNTYDAAGQLVKVEKGVNANGPPGSNDSVTFAQYTYTPNGKRQTLADAAGNTSTYAYDGFDRLSQLTYPSATRGTPTSDPANYEAFTYDANGNRLSFRRRNGQTITYAYDALDRLQVKTLPAGSPQPTVTYTYNLLNQMISASFPAGPPHWVYFSYDIAGRKVFENQVAGAVSYSRDEAGNMTALWWPDGSPSSFGYDADNNMISAGSYATFSYDNIGRLSGISGWNGTITNFYWDNANRMVAQRHYFPASGQPNDNNYTSYNPASQAVSFQRADPYVWKGQPSVATNDAYDGLNRSSRLLALGAGAYHANGNLVNDGTNTYSYDAENHMIGVTSGPVTSTETYDPLGRLYAHQTSSGGTVYFLYDGDRIIGEYSSPGNPYNPLRQYVYGPGTDAPIAWIEGGSTTYWLHPDREGSIVAWSDSSGVAVNPGANINRMATYGPWGEPSTWNMPRFGYTGQAVLPEIQLYYYKARLYSPALGRFLQTDPVGYDAGDTNLYAYVGDDPVDKTDPSGLQSFDPYSGPQAPEVDALTKDFGTAANMAKILSRTTLKAAANVLLLAGTEGLGEFGELAEGSAVAARAGRAASAVDTGAEASPVAGQAFTRATRREALSANRARNGGVLKSDKSGKTLVPARQSKAGVKHDPDEAHVDHIFPQSKGGSRDISNAQILSREENLKKGAKLPDDSH